MKHEATVTPALPYSDRSDPAPIKICDETGFSRQPVAAVASVVSRRREHDDAGK